MSDDQVVKNLIDFIEEKERNLQAAKIHSTNQTKTDVVQAILKELDDQLQKEAGNED